MSFAAEFRAWVDEMRVGSIRATAEFLGIARQLATTPEQTARLDQAEAARAEADELYWAMMYRACDALDECQARTADPGTP